MPDLSTPMPRPAPSLMAPLRISRLTARNAHPVTLEPDAPQRAAVAQFLQIESLRKFRFCGQLKPLGRRDWELRADLGATVVQLCAVSLVPVTTRIDETVIRRFIADLPEPEALEVEMPEDDSIEHLGPDIDISAIAIEALSLALPAYPRAPDAELAPGGSLDQAPPDAAPLSESRPNPFAALASLQGKLEKDPDAPPRDDD